MISRIARLALALYCVLGVGIAFGDIRRALVIGVSDYPKYDANPIRFAHIDALTFKQFLESDGAGRVEVKALINEGATRDAILDAVESLRNEQPRPDTLFVFFSGHAELDPDTNQLYLMPTGGDRKRLSATGVLASEFITNLKAAVPSNLLIFLDACHTGAAILGKGGPNESGPGILNPLIASLNKGNEGGVMVFLSAAKDELSWEDDDGGQGIFTRLLIKGLEGEADGVGDQKDGKITAGELQNFLAREVPNRARALGKPAQHPVISPDFKGSYIIALVPNSSQHTPGVKSSLKVPDIPQLRIANPEVALMVHAGVLRLTSPSLTWSTDSIDIIHSFETARVVKVGALPASIRPESLISPVISSDGSVLVACSEPSSLVSISLKSGAAIRRLPLPSASAAGSRSTILDSCDISISRDRRYVIARLRTIDGRSRLSLVALEGGAPPPSLAIADYESGVFLRDVMLISKAGTVAVVTPGTWATGPTKDLGKPIRALVADPESANFGALFDVGSGFYSFDDNARLFAGNEYSWLTGACYPTGDFLYCARDRGFIFQDIFPGGGGSGGFGCGSGSPRGFPSNLTHGAPGWTLLFECATEPETLRFIRSVELNAEVRMPEPILTARLLAGGKVTVVGQRGGIYTLDGVKYGDCCTLQVFNPSVRTHISAGSNGMTAVFEWDGHSGMLSVYHGHDLVKRLTLSDANWVEQLGWSGSNRAVALAGESQVRLIEFAGNNFQNTHERNFDCGMPTAVDNSDLTLLCVAPGFQKVQLRSVVTGKVQRELDGHVGPVQQIYLSGTTVTAAGTFTGRSQTLVTVWNASDGKVVSQHSCPVGGAQAEKPFSFIRQGNYFAQLDTPTRLLTRQSLTCESSKPLSTGPARMLRAASAADWVVYLMDDYKTVFHILNPWGENPPLPWNMELPIENLAISPDGDDIVVVVGGRILRIPITKVGFLNLVKQRIQREFSAQECDEFFPQGGCPLLKR
jgi:hypothetical protein